MSLRQSLFTVYIHSGVFPYCSTELGITGTQVQQRMSAKDRERMEETKVLAALQEEGLIQRSVSKANYGLSFEVNTAGGAHPALSQQG